MKKILVFMLFFSTLLLAFSCKKEAKKDETQNPTGVVTPEGMIKIAETYIPGNRTKAYIYAKQSLIVGYNTIYVAMYDSVDGSRQTNGHFHLDAMMIMGMDTQSCPIEENEDIDPATNLYNSSLVLTMPSSDMGTWSLIIGYHNHKFDLEAETEVAIHVTNSSPQKMFSSILANDDSAMVFVSFVLPEKGKTELMDAEFTIHRKLTASNFPAITDYTIEMIPVMVSMGHVSSGNLNPEHIQDGHYKGKLNFSMPGLWRIQLKLSKNGVLLTDKIYFDINVE